MAIGSIYKTLEFDGENSGDYGIYITGEAVYNAPERSVEMVTIPGRNGAFAKDNGRFENIEVTYPAGVFADNEADFADAISEFRNMLCSRTGYCRLSDDYNPDEYREAVYKSGLEVTPAQLKAGEFNITFECKPQRFLTSGETAVSVANNGTITNPTLFDSKPLLEVEGYGTIGFNGYEIELEDGYIGQVVLIDQVVTTPKTVSFEQSMLNDGDTITISGNTTRNFGLTITTATSSSTDFTITYSGSTYTISHQIEVTKGTSETFSSDFLVEGSSGGLASSSGFRLNVTYTSSGDTGSITFEALNIMVNPPTPMSNFSWTVQTIGNSTVWKLGNPTYIDCELGECYMYNDGSLVSLNAYIDLGSDLPKLAPGTNTCSIDNTITDLTVTPRYWKV